LQVLLVFLKPLRLVLWMQQLKLFPAHFGTFYVGERSARSGRNPRTGATINIKAAKSPKFRAGKGLKDAVN